MATSKHSTAASATEQSNTGKTTSSRGTGQQGAETKGKTQPAGSAEGKTLVIVESPAKARTIEKYLGTRFRVLASNGQVIDLPKSRMAVDIEHDFEPEYITVRGKAEKLKELTEEAKKSKGIVLASDPDREGEAIAYLIGRYLADKAKGKPIQRVTFNEITKQAVQEAMQHPRDINASLVEAQKARRVIDRLVGYTLSPLLWKKVKSGLSAGRVQSVALQLICDREREVESFVPEEYWTVEAQLHAQHHAIKAELALYQGAKPSIPDEKTAHVIIGNLKGHEARVADIQYSDRTVRPKPPFTTSKLQQAAANRLGFTSTKTMKIAQQLYEGVDLGSQRIGLITYMRTDSTRISESALQEAHTWLLATHPEQTPEAPQRYSAATGAQDAHEAIRPTRVSLTPEEAGRYLKGDHLKLYTMIWERFVASQMKPAIVRTHTADIEIGEGIFRASATSFVEEGFYKVIRLGASREERTGHTLPLAKGQVLRVDRMQGIQHFTQGPSRYTDASIVRALEELGIGRPSTYAPTIETLIERFYVQREKRQLVPTALGKAINDILSGNFPEVINTGFTAEMEAMLDKVEEQQVDWVAELKKFYFPFRDKVARVIESLEDMRGRFDEPTGEACPVCGKPLVKKLGRFGYFVSCSAFPACTFTKPVALAKCPRCGGDIVPRVAAKGRRKKFYGCSNYPQCDFLTLYRPTGSNCPRCGWFLVEKYDKKRGVHKACINPDCDYLHSEEEKSEEGRQEE
ncbi:MAG: type I DNA topoisomerase [Spirochaetales bacterium]|nr:type I DNA topoisomerase [Spirochaetales bacterium]